MLALDDGRLEPELRGADRRHIAAGACPDDQDVIGLIAHFVTSLVRSIQSPSSRDPGKGI